MCECVYHTVWGGWLPSMHHRSHELGGSASRGGLHWGGLHPGGCLQGVCIGGGGLADPSKIYGILQGMVNKWAAHLPLECIFVYHCCCLMWTSNAAAMSLMLLFQYKRRGVNNMHEVPKVSAEGQGHTLQYPGSRWRHSHANAILSCIIPCSLGLVMWWIDS